VAASTDGRSGCNNAHGLARDAARQCTDRHGPGNDAPAARHRRRWACAWRMPSGRRLSRGGGRPSAAGAEPSSRCAWPSRGWTW